MTYAALENRSSASLTKKHLSVDITTSGQGHIDGEGSGPSNTYLEDHPG